MSILAIAFSLMLCMAIAPALAETGKAFTVVGQEAAMSMLVIPLLAAIVPVLLTEVVPYKLKNNRILYLSFALFLVGGVGMFFLHRIQLILLCRGILGLCLGCFLSSVLGLLEGSSAEHEHNPRGVFQGGVCEGLIVAGLLASFLTANVWSLAFLTYGFLTVCLLLAVVCLPEPPRIAVAQGRELLFSVGREGLCIWIGVLHYTVVCFVCFGYLAQVVAGKGLGDSKLSGYATMLVALGVLCLVPLSWSLIRRLQNYALFVALLTTVVGFAVLSTAYVWWEVCVGSVYVGLGFGLLMPCALERFNESSGRPAAWFVNVLFLVSIHVGAIAAPNILNGIGAFFRNTDDQFIFLLCSICLFVSAVIFLLSLSVSPRNEECELL